MVSMTVARPRLLLFLLLAGCGGETAINARLAPNPALNSERQLLALLHSVSLTLDAPGGFRGTLSPGQSAGPLLATDVDGDGMLELVLQYPLGGKTALPVFKLLPGQNLDRTFQLAARGLVGEETVAVGAIESVRFYSGEAIDLMVPFDLRAAYRPPRVVGTTPRASEVGVPTALGAVEVEFSKQIDPSSLSYLRIVYQSSQGPQPLAAGSWTLHTLQVRELGLLTSRSVAVFAIDATCPLSAGTYRVQADALVRDVGGAGLDQDATREGPDPYEGSFVVGGTGEPAAAGPCQGQGGCQSNPDCNPGGGSDYLCVDHKCVRVKPTCATTKCDPGYVCDESSGTAICVEDCRKTGFCGGKTDYCGDDGLCHPCDPKAQSAKCGNVVTEDVTCVFKDGANHSCKSDLGGCVGAGACKLTVSGLRGDSVLWTSDCGTSAYTSLDGVAEQAVFACGGGIVSEQVKCLFNGSSQSQQCYSAIGSCSGVGSCVVDVKGGKGDKVDWKSTCGGYATTVIDGASESITFECAIQIKEHVDCYFVNSKIDQSCTSSKGSCKGVGSCGVELAGTPGESVVWTSSCPGSETTTVDGTTKGVKFYCP
jgi:hypothetical protein